MKIGLIPCGKKKRDFACQAKYMYTSALWRSLYGYALEHCDKVYILSAKYGLVSPDDVIEPYDKTLSGAKAAERHEWSDMVVAQMRSEGFDFDNDEFIILAGKFYRQYIVKLLKHVELPSEHLQMLQQLGAFCKWMVPLEKF